MCIIKNHPRPETHRTQWQLYWWSGLNIGFSSGRLGFKSDFGVVYQRDLDPYRLPLGVCCKKYRMPCDGT